MTRPITLIVPRPQSSLLLIVSGHAFAIIDSCTQAVVVPASKFINHLNPSSPIRTACFSPDGSILVTSGEDKNIQVWSTSQWGTLIHQQIVEKRLVQICIPMDTSSMVCSDKHGDIWTFPIPKSETSIVGDSALRSVEKGTVIAGHVSMITTSCLLANDSLLVSADRDEKIRISQFPNAYNIHSFLLGHLQFVSHVLPVGDELLVSAGGDDFIPLWHWPSAKIVHKAHLRPYIDQTSDIAVRSLYVSDLYVAAIVEGTNFVLIFMIDPALQTISFFQKIVLPDYLGLALSASFDASNHLWVGAFNGLVTATISAPELVSTVGISDFGDVEATSVENIYMFESLRKIVDMFENGDENICHETGIK